MNEFEKLTPKRFSKNDSGFAIIATVCAISVMACAVAVISVKKKEN